MGGRERGKVVGGRELREGREVRKKSSHNHQAIAMQLHKRYTMLVKVAFHYGGYIHMFGNIHSDST